MKQKRIANKPFCLFVLFYFFIYNLEGGLFTEDEDEQELVFKHAVAKINSDQTILPRSALVAQIEKVRPEDSFRANKKGTIHFNYPIINFIFLIKCILYSFRCGLHLVCGLLRNGVAAIFGPFSGTTSMHVQSICDALEIPHIDTRLELQAQRDDLSINLFPRSKILARAYLDVVRAWNWDRFVVVYEDDDGKSID